MLEQEDTQDVIVVNRARSNYSEKRLKEISVQKRYGETRAQYLWRLLRVFIRKTIDAVSKSDLEERNISHGVSHLRSMKVGSKIKSMAYNYYAKEIVTLDKDNFVSFFKSDGRYISNFVSVDLLQDTSNKFIKYSVPNKIYDSILYCSKDRQFVGWKPGEKEINLFSNTLELLSIAKSFEPIDCLGYNSKTGDIVTCASNSELTHWNFRYGAKHLIPRASYKNCLNPNFKYNFIVIEPSEAPVMRCYIASNISITVVNIFDGTVLSNKDELHIRQITAMTFYDPMKYLVTASKEGSIKVWDQKWFLKMVFVGHNSSVLSLSIHPLAPYIISSSLDKTIKIWSLDQQDIVEQIDVEEPVTQIITEKYNPKFLTYSSDTIRIWKVNHIYEMFTNIGRKVTKIIEVDHKKFPKRMLALCDTGGFHIINPGVGTVLTSLILSLKIAIVDAVYSSCENLAVVYLENGDLLKVDTRTNPCRILQTNRKFPKTISKLMLYEYYSDGTQEFKPDDDDDEFKYLNETSMVYKVLRLKSSKELTNVKLKGFDRTLLFAGCKDGSICTLRWDNLDMDYEIEMHNNREILQLVPNVKEDQIISAGLDLVIKLWRVYPYAADTLGLLRTIFCAYPPQMCCILKDRLCVGFNDMKTLTHTIVFFNRLNNERYDHRPEDDHSERIVAIAACDKMKIIASAGAEGLIKIWNMECKLIRLIKLKEKPHSLAFCSAKADLLIGIGNHIFRISHKSYLPKAFLFKMVSMEFEDVVKEEAIPYSNDVRQLLTPTSFQRLKSAHKNEYRSETETIRTVESENEESDSEVFDFEQKQRNDGIALLIERDTELRKLTNGEIKHKARPMKKKTAREAFENYMRLYFDDKSKVKIEEPEFFFLSDADLFPKPVKPAKNEIYQHKDPGAFFPPITFAKYKKPYKFLADDYSQRVKRCRNTLDPSEEQNDDDDVQTTSSPKSREERQTEEKLQERSLGIMTIDSVSEFTETKSKAETEMTSVRPRAKDQETQTGSDFAESEKIKKRKSVNLPAEINTEDKPSKFDQTVKVKRAKSKSRTSDAKPPSTISPILEQSYEQEEDEEQETKRRNINDDSSVSIDMTEKNFKSSSIVPIPPIKLNSQQPAKKSAKSLLLGEIEEKAPYFISGGFIPNSILIRILWPPSLLDEQAEKEKAFWKPKGLTSEQMEQLKSVKPKTPPKVIIFDDDLYEEPKIDKSKLMAKDDDDDEDVVETKPKPAEQKALLQKVNSIAINITPPPSPPSPPPVVVPETPKTQKFTTPPTKDLSRDKLDKMRSIIMEKQKTREANEQATAVEMDRSKEIEFERIEKEKSESATTRSFVTELPEEIYADKIKTPSIMEMEMEIDDLPDETQLTPQAGGTSYVIPPFILPFQDTTFFMKHYGEVPIENLPQTEENFIVDLLKKASDSINTSDESIDEIEAVLDLIIKLLKELRSKDQKKSFELVGINLINLLAKSNISGRDSKQRDFIMKCLQLLYETGTPSKTTICEWMYWYIEGTEAIRRCVRGLMESAGISEHNNYFFEELDAWEVWKIDEASKRKQVKKMCLDWLLKWTITFQMHIRETYSRLKKGSVHGRVSNTGKSILKTGPNGADLKGGLTVKFDLNHEKTTINNVTPIEAINYFCEIQHDKNKANLVELTDDGEAKNTVLVIPKLETNSVLIRLGESNTDLHRPKRKESDVVLPPIKLSARYKYGDIHSTPYVNLPLKTVQPRPFRHGVDTLTYKDNSTILEELGLLNDSFNLLTLKTSQKYFQPQATWAPENISS